MIILDAFYPNRSLPKGHQGSNRILGLAPAASRVSSRPQFVPEWLAGPRNAWGKMAFQQSGPPPRGITHLPITNSSMELGGSRPLTSLDAMEASPFHDPFLRLFDTKLDGTVAGNGDVFLQKAVAHTSN